MVLLPARRSLPAASSTRLKASSLRNPSFLSASIAASISSDSTGPPLTPSGPPAGLAGASSTRVDSGSAILGIAESSFWASTRSASLRPSDLEAIPVGHPGFGRLQGRDASSRLLHDILRHIASSALLACRPFARPRADGLILLEALRQEV